MDRNLQIVPKVRIARSHNVELLTATLTLLLGIVIFAGSVIWRHHTAEAFSSKGLAKRLKPDAVKKPIGDVGPDKTSTVTFKLWNDSDRPIRIQGAQTSCTCTVVDGIPCVIEPGDSKEIRGVVHTDEKPGEFTGSFVLYTDDDRESEIRLGYYGRVVVDQH